MKTATLPVICGTIIAATSAAGLSHWWSVRQFVAAVESGLPVMDAPSRVSPDISEPARPAKESPSPASSVDAIVAKNSSVSEKEFFKALVTKIESLQNQNRDLLDQVAETNRDLMKLEFRVDTHSESFRPLPMSEDHPFTTKLDDAPGVLPPRAEPVLPTLNE